jgi:hypothetical protein
MAVTQIINKLTTAPVMQVVNVSATMDLMPSETTSVLLSGTRLPRPPIIIPTSHAGSGLVI